MSEQEYYQTEVDITDLIKKALIKRGATQNEVDSLYDSIRIKAGVDVYRNCDGELYQYKEYIYLDD